MNSEKLEGADSNLKSQFLYSLNSSGKYYAFKEDLKVLTYISTYVHTYVFADLVFDLFFMRTYIRLCV